MGYSIKFEKPALRSDEALKILTQIPAINQLCDWANYLSFLFSRL